jgi:tetratricopeptide (TPR) repeat protein
MKSGSLVMLRCAAAFSVLVLFGACSEQKAPPPPAQVKDDTELLLEKAQADPKDADTWFHVADNYERASQFPQEIDALKKVIAARPGMGWAHVKMGNAYNRLGRHEDAVAAFLAAEKLLPQNPMLFNNLGWTYGRLGKPNEAIVAYQRAVALRPRFSAARLNLGLVLLKKGDRAGAEAQHAALLEFDAGAAETLLKEMEARKK